MLCIPYAGAGIAAFRGWQDGLPDTEVLVAQLPGRDARLRETADTDLAGRAAGIADALAAYRDRPLIVYGHSMGAVIALEVTRRLAEAGAPPLALAVSGRRAPSRPGPLPSIAHLPMDDFIQEMQNRYAAIPPVVLQDADLRALFLPILRGDIAALEAHAHREADPLPCPILVYGGAADPHAPAADLDPWGQESRLGARVRLLPGGHFFIQTSRDAFLAALIADVASVPRASAPAGASL